MRTIFWWIVGIIAACVIFVGTASAAAVRDTIAGTTGETAGLTVGGIPLFVQHFQHGMRQGDMKPKTNSSSLSNWSVAPPEVTVPRKKVAPAANKLHA